MLTERHFGTSNLDPERRVCRVDFTGYLFFSTEIN